MKRNAILISVLLMFLGGMGLFLYPTVSDYLSSIHHSTAIQTYRQEVEGLDEGYLAEEREAAELYNKQLTQNVIADPFIPGTGTMLPENYTAILNFGGVMGYVEIPKASIRLPIYHGTGEDALQRGVGHLESTELPIGGVGNHAVLTGHRGLPASKLFTDLDQVEVGDTFYLYVLDEVLAYEVEEILVIDPDDTSCLHPVSGQDYVSLITCTPYAINSHRLVVRGARIPYHTSSSQGALEQSQSVNGVAVFRALVIGIVILLATVLILLTIRRRR